VIQVAAIYKNRYSALHITPLCYINVIGYNK